MKIGIIGEGVSDIAVIERLLKAVVGIDISSDVIHLLPDMRYDQTDLGMTTSFSNWSHVKRVCEEGALIKEFFSLDEERFLIIHLDSDLAGESGFDVARPKKGRNYATDFHAAVLSKLIAWLGVHGTRKDIFFAIAIEEIEAWLIPLYDKNINKDTCSVADPKDALNRVISRYGSKSDKESLRNKSKYDTYVHLSKPLLKGSNLKLASKWNKSLELFLDSVGAIPKIKP